MNLTFEQAVLRYGPIERGTWVNEGKWCSNLWVPQGLTWIKTATGNPIKYIYCNEDIHIPLYRALQKIADSPTLNELLKTFDGAFQIRNVRGEDKLSAHSYGIAIDINAADNPLGSPGNISKDLVKCFTDEYFVWGGAFKRKDPMHFSMGW